MLKNIFKSNREKELEAIINNLELIIAGYKKTTVETDLLIRDLMKRSDEKDAVIEQLKEVIMMFKVQSKLLSKPKEELEEQ